MLEVWFVQILHNELSRVHWSNTEDDDCEQVRKKEYDIQHYEDIPSLKLCKQALGTIKTHIRKLSIHEEVDLLKHNALIADNLDKQTKWWHHDGRVLHAAELNHSWLKNEESNGCDQVSLIHSLNQIWLGLEVECIFISLLKRVSVGIIDKHHQVHGWRTCQILENGEWIPISHFYLEYL